MNYDRIIKRFVVVLTKVTQILFPINQKKKIESNFFFQKMSLHLYKITNFCLFIIQYSFK